MKRIAGILIGIVLLSFSGFGQQGKQWITGFGNVIDFNSDTAYSYMQCDTFDNTLYIVGHSGICDSNGKLVFAYTGILPIKNCENIVENGIPDINNHFAQDAHGNGNLIQHSIILPKNSTLYYAIYNSASNEVFDSAANGADAYFDQLFFDIIDMSENGGQGKVIDKHHVMTLDGQMTINSMSAVKHANGRDWWLVKPHVHRHYFYTFLVTPEKV